MYKAVPIESVATVWRCDVCRTEACMTADDHASIGEPVCGDCGQPMVPKYGIVRDACTHGEPACTSCKEEVGYA